jgi:hypothetical protein
VGRLVSRGQPTDRCAETINYLHTQFGLLKERVDKVWLLP